MPITLPSLTRSKEFAADVHHEWHAAHEECYVWAVYKWQPINMRWAFDRFWKTGERVPALFPSVAARMNHPPGWDETFNPLGINENCFLVRYPAPEIVRLEYATSDNRFNHNDDT